jgi:hypothetical protein
MPPQAASCFQRAIEIARKRSAKSVELRTTISFSRLLARQARRDEARSILAEIYGWFTEGFDTRTSVNLRRCSKNRCQPSLVT